MTTLLPGAVTGLSRAIAIGVPALVMATSCVPLTPPKGAQGGQRIVRLLPEPDARTLLRRLALRVPTGVPRDVLTPDAAPAPLIAAPPFQLAARTDDDAARARECLTEAVYYEARSQDRDGQRAVAQVVLNRVRDRAFPKSVCGVVYQGSERRTGCQFSFTCDGSMNGRRDDSAWARAADVADAALSGDVFSAVGSATYYHANYVLPWWAASMARITQVGAHIFYRWRSGMEDALAFRQSYAGVEPQVAAPYVAPVALAGVSVHYGNRPETDAAGAIGISIHRGAFAPPQAPRPASVSGVRVHVGPHDVSAGEETADMADVSDEI
ncbi:MAG TPA: cell wall hydrolase [Sphingomonas sp.]|nr:cell wall hydrolase [Sphingomonas sp.]